MLVKCVAVLETKKDAKQCFRECCQNFSKRRHPGVGRCRSRCIEVSKKEFVNILYKLIGSIKKMGESEGSLSSFRMTRKTVSPAPTSQNAHPQHHAEGGLTSDAKRIAGSLPTQG